MILHVRVNIFRAKENVPFHFTWNIIRSKQEIAQVAFLNLSIYMKVVLIITYNNRFVA